jgi:hypothetical protein
MTRWGGAAAQDFFVIHAAQNGAIELYFLFPIFFSPFVSTWFSAAYF